MPGVALIEVESLMFRWPSADLPCLVIERFQVSAGARVFLFGTSGSGKSTLLALLGGVLTPQDGRIRVLDAELTAMNSRARDRFRVKHVGFIFQQFNLVPYLPVMDNVLLPCRFSSTRAAGASEADGTPADAARRLLESMRLGPTVQARPVTELSVGQQQRVAVARALIGRPELIIADEPTSSLDADAQQTFLELLLRECDRWATTLLFVSHNRQLASYFDREVDLPAINEAQPVAGGFVKHLLGLALASAWNRRLTLGLTLSAIALSIAMLLSVERARSAARESFAQSISGTDLVVGARTSPVQLMLYAVFRLGEATNSMRWKSFEALFANPAVAWAIPLSLGDSHRGFPVLGTTAAYFEHFRYGSSRALRFKVDTASKAYSRPCLAPKSPSSSAISRGPHQAGPRHRGDWPSRTRRQTVYCGGRAGTHRHAG
jgi:putative ABC transport system ATP-binding protein